jgi:hypothetical protein
MALDRKHKVMHRIRLITGNTSSSSSSSSLLLGQVPYLARLAKQQAAAAACQLLPAYRASMLQSQPL